MEISHLADVPESIAELDEMRVDVAPRDAHFRVVLLGADPDARYRLRVPAADRRPDKRETREFH